VGAATAKLQELKHVRHVGQPTNYSLMNEVYETEHITLSYNVIVLLTSILFNKVDNMLLTSQL